MLRDEVVSDDPPADQMLVNDAIEHRRIAPAVPGALWIDDDDRTVVADAEAIHLRPKHAAQLGEPELLQATFEEVPRGEAAILLAALRVRLIAADEDVSPRGRHTNGFGRFPLTIGHV